MPKMKTHSSAKKRFRISASGKVRCRAAHKRHRLISKSKRQKRAARQTMTLCAADARSILENFLPYSRGKRAAKAATSTQKEAA